MELFNHAHSSLRSVIKRCFGVLKARFPILKKITPYPISTQMYIIVAPMAIHNFIRQTQMDDWLFNEYANEDQDYEKDQTMDDEVEINNMVHEQQQEMKEV